MRDVKLQGMHLKNMYIRKWNSVAASFNNDSFKTSEFQSFQEGYACRVCRSQAVCVIYLDTKHLISQ